MTHPSFSLMRLTVLLGSSSCFGEGFTHRLSEQGRQRQLASSLMLVQYLSILYTTELTHYLVSADTVKPRSIFTDYPTCSNHPGQ